MSVLTLSLKMSNIRDLLKLAEALNAIDCETLHYNKNRILLLLKRVKITVDLVEKNITAPTVDMAQSQSIMLLCITLEEILEYANLFSKSDQALAGHIVKYGSDEEQFIKWNERLQHCAAEMDLEVDVFDVFNDKSDITAFENDIARMKDDMLNIVVLLYGANNEGLLKAMENLLKHQTNVRATYQTKTAPDASLTINPKRVKYECVIGHGGILF
jgi:hypothetical protein